MSVRSQVGFFMAVLLLAGCAAPPPPPQPDTRAADEEALRALIKTWSGAAAAKNPEGFASVYARDAILMLEDAPDVRGVAALREAIAGLMQDPHFALSFAPDDVTVSRSGDMAYEVGTYSLTMSDPEGNASTDNGQYVVVWQKEEDGSWKVVVDAPVSDAPPGEAAAH